jgi:hypothetical protein
VIFFLKHKEVSPASASACGDTKRKGEKHVFMHFSGITKGLKDFRFEWRERLHALLVRSMEVRNTPGTHIYTVTRDPYSKYVSVSISFIVYNT